MEQRTHYARQLQRLTMAALAIRKSFDPLAYEVGQVCNRLHVVGCGGLLWPDFETVKVGHLVKCGRIDSERIERSVQLRRVFARKCAADRLLVDVDLVGKLALAVNGNDTRPACHQSGRYVRFGMNGRTDLFISHLLPHHYERS
ncbi:hypothetical protein [Novosphingobium sp. ES2-1]|uniref:hypothetical protein n=1 Tax=Novosphingobium sp. ES2-1 TaxID=2780074 RepID=UPI00187DE702|nr:hypothetical protein [Novosphingobium sp. ES2-1]QOV95244.1 hypothetical protein IM701_07455 [Novosphingobium sp. ES2-1]